MNYSESLEFIERSKVLGSVLGLERTYTLMRYLGNPEMNLKFIHVTGTNGKGSTCACLNSILTAAGIRTGMFTSPYFERYNEQYIIGGREISDTDFASSTERVAAAIDEMTRDGLSHPTEFEITVAIGLCAFEAAKCDIVILEVGLGGRDDATNIIPAPELAIITPISLDHTGFLGSSHEEIAEVKSGIIKPGCMVLTARQPEGAMNVILNTCAEKRVSVYEISGQATCASCSLEGQVINLPEVTIADYTYSPLSDVFTPLLADYQLENITTALYASYILASNGWPLDESSIRNGLKAVQWSGRFEKISDNPTFIIDGAHNPSGIHELTRSISRYLKDTAITMIAGVLADKDYKHMMAAMAPYASKIFTITVPNPRTLAADELADYFRSLAVDATPCDSIEEAVDAAIGEATGNSDGAVLAFGSLYYVGEVRKLVKSKL